jgi:hypothetical protein
MTESSDFSKVSSVDGLIIGPHVVSYDSFTLHAGEFITDTTSILVGPGFMMFAVFDCIQSKVGCFAAHEVGLHLTS